MHRIYKVKYKEAVTYWLDTLDTEFYCTVIQSFVPQWDKCQWWRFGVDISYPIRVSFMHRLQTKFSASEGCLIFLLLVLLFVWLSMAAFYTWLGSTLCFAHDMWLKSAGFYCTYGCIYYSVEIFSSCGTTRPQFGEILHVWSWKLFLSWFTVVLFVIT
jgi:hypothetical protein